MIEVKEETEEPMMDTSEGSHQNPVLVDDDTNMLLSTHLNHSATIVQTHAKVNNQMIQVVLDTGSNTTLVTKKTADKLGFQLSASNTGTIGGINGVKTSYLGRIHNFPITFGANTIPIEVLVINYGNYDILLGTD